jgi:hypothetical protein
MVNSGDGTTKNGAARNGSAEAFSPDVTRQFQVDGAIFWILPKGLDLAGRIGKLVTYPLSACRQSSWGSSLIDQPGVTSPGQEQSAMIDCSIGLMSVKEAMGRWDRKKTCRCSHHLG